MFERLQGQALILTVSTLTALSFMLIGYDNGVIGEENLAALEFELLIYLTQC